MSEPSKKTKVEWLELEVQKQRERIAELEGYLEASSQLNARAEQLNKLFSDMAAALAELADGYRERMAGLERQLTSMRASFHVNMVRAFPAKSHEEISAEIDRALEITGVRK